MIKNPAILRSNRNDFQRTMQHWLPRLWSLLIRKLHVCEPDCLQCLIVVRTDAQSNINRPAELGSDERARGRHLSLRTEQLHNKSLTLTFETYARGCFEVRLDFMR